MNNVFKANRVSVQARGLIKRIGGKVEDYSDHIWITLPRNVVQITANDTQTVYITVDHTFIADLIVLRGTTPEHEISILHDYSPIWQEWEGRGLSELKDMPIAQLFNDSQTMMQHIVRMVEHQVPVPYSLMHAYKRHGLVMRYRMSSLFHQLFSNPLATEA